MGKNLRRAMAVVGLSLALAAPACSTAVQNKQPKLEPPRDCPSKTTVNTDYTGFQFSVVNELVNHSKKYKDDKGPKCDVKNVSVSLSVKYIGGTELLSASAGCKDGSSVDVTDILADSAHGKSLARRGDNCVLNTSIDVEDLRREQCVSDYPDTYRSPTIRCDEINIPKN